MYFNTDEHQTIGNEIKFPKEQISRKRKDLQEDLPEESTSGEHKTIGDMVTTSVNSKRSLDKVTYNADEHHEIGSMIDLPVNTRESDFMAHEHQEFGKRIELPAKDMNEHNTGKHQANGYAIKFKKVSRSRKVKGLTENLKKSAKIDQETGRKMRKWPGEDFVDGCKEVGKGVMGLEFIVYSVSAECFYYHNYEDNHFENRHDEMMDSYFEL